MVSGKVSAAMVAGKVAITGEETLRAEVSIIASAARPAAATC